jgi:uncharacterized protein YbjT (DUF2867 family)
MVAVIGATGLTGRATVKELKGLGENPLCIVRNAEKAREVLGADAKLAIAEVTDRAALEKAFAGIKRLFVVTGHNPQIGEQQINIINAAKAAGVAFIVKVSGGRGIVNPNSDSVVGRGHYAVEEAMKVSGLAWCILSPGMFMQNTLAQAASIKKDGKMVMPFAKDIPIAFIDVRDTGALGARVLREPNKHAGKIYDFTGAVSSFGKFAEDFSAVLGRSVSYIGATLEQAEQGMKARQMPDWLITHMLAIARLAIEDSFVRDLSQPIRDIVGRAPITTRQFVQDHKAAFV